MTDEWDWQASLSGTHTDGFRQKPSFPLSSVAKPHDAIDHPSHYTAHTAGIEAIDVVEAFDFNTGNAMKYLWRAGLKGDAPKDYRKARWYGDRAIKRLEAR